jgi:CubicO group peptidase (beta-lactamase class C family)
MMSIRLLVILSICLGMNFQIHADENISKLLEPVRKKYALPALAAMILNSKGIIASDVSGVRKVKTDIPATINDKWHLGSDTKAMTATLIARFIEQDKLQWDTKLASIFPELSDHFDPGFKEITLIQILTHFAGLPKNVDYMRILKIGGPVQTQRISVLKEGIGKPPIYQPGTKYSYSNVGYIILGAVLEKVSNSSWEDLIQKELFLPLQMKSAGFGGAVTLGKIDQPCGHLHNGEPVEGYGPALYNLQMGGPAGSVHCTLEDWSKFVADHLRGARGIDGLLKSKTYIKLQTPMYGNKSACGWGITNNSIVGAPVLSHRGSNNMNFAAVVMAPTQDFAVLVCTNQGGENAGNACSEAVDILLSFQMEKLKPTAKARP